MLSEQVGKKAAIMKAALELFAGNGFHHAPISQIARKAQVGAGTIYRYFQDKDNLIHELYKEIEEELHVNIAGGAGPAESNRDQFVALIVNLVHYLKERPGEFKFLEQYYNSPYGIEKKRAKFLQETSPDCQNPFLRIFASGKNRDVKDMPVHILHALAFGPVTFMLRNYTAGLVTLDEPLIRMLAEACWDAIAK